MIFVTVGNWDTGFDRLIEAVDDLVARGVIKEQVVAQTGPGKYQANYVEAMEFCSPDYFGRLIKEARVVISHSGMGTIAQAIRNGKPVVVVPRKASMGEHFDDHQFATAEVLEEEGKILVAYEVSGLGGKIEEAGSFVPNNQSSSGEIIKAVDEFVAVVARAKTRS